MWGLSALSKPRINVGQFLQSIRNSSYLGQLQHQEGAVKGYKRLGRGPASGKGKTSGRGQKGQKARGSVPFLFEGGQTPFFKRFPIVGFKRPHAKEYNFLSMKRIQDFWDNKRIPLEAGQTLTIRVMRECGLISGTMKDGVKLMGYGGEEYTVPLNIEASKATEFAIESVQNTGHAYTSVYHTKLGLKAHLNPDYYLLKKGYVPLQARPTHKKDVAYYSNPDKYGYLLKDPDMFLEKISVGKQSRITKEVKKSSLERMLEGASKKVHGDFSQSAIVDVSSFA
ncbi:hypothetical protein PUMCH_002575 [Australozyma saopauloensis]|uniref:Large ribosomal subunit protein uL15/eL18 domain-containing protein n=1 Tax=Australozyma saopauloensis TaxID=291208 RepID=A0AAX4H9N1_9ASCO|nr:hypothetical protein PUMCH_002575 [[Candida] saopauloensis]